MFALTRFEIKKMLVHKRSWFGVGSVLMINGLFALAFYMRNKRFGGVQLATADKRMAGELTDAGLAGRLAGEFLNAFSYTQTILAPCMYMLFPMVLAIIACHSLAGELEVGSLRLILTRPVSRMQILAAKLATVTLYSAAMLAGLGIVSYAVSASMFPARGDVIIFGPMFMLKETLIVHNAADMPLRLLLSYAMALPMLVALSAMGLMFAAITRQFTSAAIITGTVYFCSYIVSGIPLLSAIHPFMPTRHLPFWRLALKPEIPWDFIASHALWTCGYGLAFFAIAVAVFYMQDI